MRGIIAVMARLPPPTLCQDHHVERLARRGKCRQREGARRCSRVARLENSATGQDRDRCGHCRTHLRACSSLGFRSRTGSEASLDFQRRSSVELFIVLELDAPAAAAHPSEQLCLGRSQGTAAADTVLQLYGLASAGGTGWRLETHACRQWSVHHPLQSLQNLTITQACIPAPLSRLTRATESS